MKDKIENKIFEIADVLTTGRYFKGYGLYSGLSGECLFFAELYKMTRNKKYYKVFISKFNEVFEWYFSNKIPEFSFSSGIIGILWLNNYFIKIGLADSENIDKDLLELVHEYSLRMISKNKTYDFIHGGLGALIYYNSFINNNTYNEKISELVKETIKISYQKNDLIFWDDILTKNLNPDENYHDNFTTFGLSHGIPSILMILSKAYKIVCDKQIAIVIEKGVNYLLTYEFKVPTFSYFPCNSANMIPSRLAWCYGDLGIANMLYLLGKQFSNNEWLAKSLEIFNKSAGRNDLNLNSVTDAGICHGTSGISHIFRRMYLRTGSNVFLKAYDYWINETLKMAKFENGLAGYKANHGIDEGWINESGFLEGIAGIGLVLLSSISNEAPDWDECLLLS